MGYRLWDDGMGGKVHDGFNVILGEQPADQGTIAGIADDELSMDHSLFKARAERVEDEYLPAAFP
jgi:hypothetical protein